MISARRLGDVRNAVQPAQRERARRHAMLAAAWIGAMVLLVILNEVLREHQFWMPDRPRYSHADFQARDVRRLLVGVVAFPGLHLATLACALWQTRRAGGAVPYLLYLVGLVAAGAHLLAAYEWMRESYLELPVPFTRYVHSLSRNGPIFLAVVGLLQVIRRFRSGRRAPQH